MTMRGYPDTFEPGAKRFDGGGRPNPIGLPMLDVALQQVAEVTCILQHLYAYVLTCLLTYG